MFATIITTPGGRAVAATMTRLALAVALSVLAAPLVVVAQQAPKIAKIGLLSASTPAASAHLLEAFRQGLRDLGQVDGKTFVLELRFAEGRVERLPDLARELVRLKVDVIVTSTDMSIAAARQQTRTLHEARVIKSTPQRIMVQGTDWRFLNELKKELKE
jgi:ABC-type uncharacterized transport system substrate-binding protein